MIPGLHEDQTRSSELFAALCILPDVSTKELFINKPCPLHAIMPPFPPATAYET